MVYWADRPAQVRPVLMNSGLPGASLAKIWELSDIDKDGKLDRIEMSIALHLVYNTLKGESIPPILPPALDGKLDRIEMSIALHLVYNTLKGESIPPILPPALVHPSKVGKQHRMSVVKWSAEARDKSRHSSVTSLDTCGLVGGAKFNINYSDYTNRSQSVQPYSSINAQTSCASLPALESRSQSVGGVWPIETSLYEAQFLKADKNKD
ncbi:unnamed protein product, partial [Anisakis simplex]|uniref:Epidermal growth factor receptor substrate 15-like 1 n=1 Tax=Anisakis simplex TaxID=6269 RepID=A0A0M3KGI2_ANISI